MGHGWVRSWQSESRCHVDRGLGHPSMAQSAVKEHEAVHVRRSLVLLGALSSHVVHYLRHIHEAQGVQLLVQLLLTRLESLCLVIKVRFERTLPYDVRIPAAKVRCSTLHFKLVQDHPDVVSSEPSLQSIHRKQPSW